MCVSCKYLHESCMQEGKSEEFTLDERILSLATDTWGSKMFNNMSASLNSCQHPCRPPLHGNVIVRPVSRENMNVSCISRLWDSYFLS